MKKPWKKEEGFSFVWLAMIMVLLIGMTGFGTDLGWLYLNTSRAQKAVDAAAMAGVVNLPGFPVQAQVDADSAATANGYDPGGADTLTITPIDDNELHAQLTTSVEPFFIKVLGFNSFDITREATAQYVKPVPLGSPDQCFGRAPGWAECAGALEDFWGAVSGPYTRKQDGDPYSTRCYVNSSATSCASGNADYQRSGSYGGYYFGVEVPDVPGGVSNLGVWVYDARYNGGSCSVDTGDCRYGIGVPSGGNPGPDITTNFSFHSVDTTPLNPIDNPLYGSCSWTLGPGGGGYENTWRQLCQVNGTVTPGIWVLHVETVGSSGAGSNNYSVGARLGGGAGPQPRVFGINDMSIWSNNLTQASELFLAEIDPVHSGKKLELQIYDPGDAQMNSWYSVLDPFGNTPNCIWDVLDHNGSPISTGNTGPCSWQTTDESQTDPETGGPLRVFNERWINAIIDLPSDPALMCNPGLPADRQCYWKMDLNLSDPNERTTWRIRVIGNPVRLIP